MFCTDRSKIQQSAVETDLVVSSWPTWIMWHNMHFLNISHFLSLPIHFSPYFWPTVVFTGNRAEISSCRSMLRAAHFMVCWTLLKAVLPLKWMRKQIFNLNSLLIHFHASDTKTKKLNLTQILQHEEFFMLKLLWQKNELFTCENKIAADNVTIDYCVCACVR